jgi:SAM-dependent methyltransferase
LDIYERSHYARNEHVDEVEQILSWFDGRSGRVLDAGCCTGLHALEFARRGFSVAGLDIEPAAVERASRRARQIGAAVAFSVKDLSRDSLTSLGTFDFVYSLGNVLAHIEKGLLPAVLARIHACLNRNGVFLFDLLMTDNPFLRDIRDEKHKIFWKRARDGETGKIRMDGYFLEFGFVQPFEVWGYSLDDVRGLLSRSGFVLDAMSNRLDFPNVETGEGVPFCLNFRVRRKEDR